MKAVFFYTLKCRLSLLMLLLVTLVSAQVKDSSATDVSDWITNKQFVFKAQTATPQTGPFVQLNYQFDVRVSGDSIISYLPYYGRAYTAPLTTDDAGLRFTTTDYSYATEKKGDDKWEITITAKAQRDTYKLFFTIYSNRQADLQVTSNNRQPIRFNGEVVGKPVK